MNHIKFPMTPEDWHKVASDPRYGPVQIEELQRRSYAAQIQIDEREAAAMSRAVFQDFKSELDRRLIRQIRLSVFGKSHPEKEVVKFPADWRQAVKERFAPKWFLKKHPVRYTTVTASLEELYPCLKQAIPDEVAYFQFAVKRETTY